MIVATPEHRIAYSHRTRLPAAERLSARLSWAPMAAGNAPDFETCRDLVRRLVAGGTPHGETFDACRAVLLGEPGSEMAFQALCMLLEGGLADASLPIRDAQVIVPLLKNLAKGAIDAGDLL